MKKGKRVGASMSVGKLPGVTAGKAADADVVWADVVRDMKELVATAQAGGMAAIKKKYKVTRVRTGVPALAPDAIAAARKAVGLSQPAFAAGLGVSAQLVRAWEQGTRQPKGAVCLLLADVAERPAHWKPKLVPAG